MVACPAGEKNAQYQDKIEQLRDQITCQFSGRIILIGVLRHLENKIIANASIKGISSSAKGLLWLTAMHERNLFLWKKHRSLAARSNYYFWTDPEQLLNNKIQNYKLRNSTGILPLNEFTFSSQENTGKQELSYCESMAGTIDNIIDKAFSLSLISIISNEQINEQDCGRTHILLPEGDQS